MTLKLAHLILTFDGLTFELTFEHSVIKSLTLEMALQNRDSGIKSRTKAYRPILFVMLEKAVGRLFSDSKRPF